MLERSSCIGFTFILIFSIISSVILVSETDGYEPIDVGEGNQIITGYCEGQEVPLLLISYKHYDEYIRQNSTLNTRITFVNLCSEVIQLINIQLIPDWVEVDEWGGYMVESCNNFEYTSYLDTLFEDYSIKYSHDPNFPETADIISISIETHVPENVSLGNHGFQIELLYVVFPELYWPDQDGGCILPRHIAGQAFDLDVFEIDSDGDGFGDSEDMFPMDPVEHQDSDLDGIGDHEDIFDHDPAEWSDEDGDGVGDNRDTFPKDPLEWSDLDGDGTGDNKDAFPKDPSAWKDYDGDGHPDHWNPSMGPENSTLGLTLDMYQIDPTRWDYRNEDEEGIGTTPYILLGLTLVFIEILVILYISSKRKGEIRDRRLRRI